MIPENRFYDIRTDKCRSKLVRDFRFDGTISELIKYKTGTTPEAGQLYRKLQ